jgi:hypothetical protein
VDDSNEIKAMEQASPVPGKRFEKIYDSENKKLLINSSDCLDPGAECNNNPKTGLFPLPLIQQSLGMMSFLIKHVKAATH